jgi:UrcA family protein
MIASAFAALALLATPQGGLQPTSTQGDNVQTVRVSFSAAEMTGDERAGAQVRAKLDKAAARACLGELRARSGGSYGACRRAAVREALKALDLAER